MLSIVPYLQNSGIIRMTQSLEFGDWSQYPFWQKTRGNLFFWLEAEHDKNKFLIIRHCDKLPSKKPHNNTEKRESEERGSELERDFFPPK